MEKTLRISVIIPVYNKCEYAIEAADSVADKMPDDCELILVDDGSDERTVELLKQYKSDHTDDNVTVKFCSHRGVSAARNTGLSLAKGKYVAFVDGDDCLEPGFFDRSLALLEKDPDLCIFSIDNYDLNDQNKYVKGEEWSVSSRVFADASEFADEYIRSRKLLIYSNCNKLYKNEIIRENSIRFEEDVSFGEDRLFNYDYLRHCGMIITSEDVMLRYMHRFRDSASYSYTPEYLKTALMLHKRKIECMEALSKGTTEEEKAEFRRYDIDRECRKALERLAELPEEEAETVGLIRDLVYRDYDRGDAEPEIAHNMDVLMVLGSGNCAYRARRAYELGKDVPDMKYIVTGGNLTAMGDMMEDELMKNVLMENGVDEKNIFIEDRAGKTRNNFENSITILESLNAEKIGIITAGFHIYRAESILKTVPFYNDKTVEWFPAYGTVTKLDNWYKHTNGINIVLYEIKVMYDKITEDLYRTKGIL